MEAVIATKTFWDDVKVQFVDVDGVYMVKFFKRDGGGRFRFTKVCLIVGNLMGLTDDLVLNANLGWIIPADKLLEIKAWITEVF